MVLKAGITPGVRSEEDATTAAAFAQFRLVIEKIFTLLWFYDGFATTIHA